MIAYFFKICYQLNWLILDYPFEWILPFPVAFWSLLDSNSCLCFFPTWDLSSKHSLWCCHHPTHLNLRWSLLYTLSASHCFSSNFLGNSSNSLNAPYYDGILFEDGWTIAQSTHSSESESWVIWGIALTTWSYSKPGCLMSAQSLSSLQVWPQQKKSWLSWSHSESIALAKQSSY